jgi:hypothetical protein
MVPTDGRGVLTLKFAGTGGADGPLKGGAEEQWGAAQWVCAQYSELQKFVIAKAEVGDKLREVAGIEVAGKG